MIFLKLFYKIRYTLISKEKMLSGMVSNRMSIIALKLDSMEFFGFASNISIFFSKSKFEMDFLSKMS